MGAISPSGRLGSEQAAQILEEVMQPAVAGLAAEGRPFTGVLYAGLMLGDDGPRVLEFNARFGDPEAQAILLRLEDDLLPILAGGASGNFGVQRLHFRKEASAVIVLASAGYPEKPVTGEEIAGLERALQVPGVEVFHGSTAVREGRLVTAGGRVLSVAATGASLIEALRTAYSAAREIHWPSRILRKDIGRSTLTSGGAASESGLFRLPQAHDS
jgi:phosphoribosylamine--glycine ligase